MKSRVLAALAAALIAGLFSSGCNGKNKGGTGEGGKVEVKNGQKPPAPRADALVFRRPPAVDNAPRLSAEDARALFRIIRSDALGKLRGELNRKTLQEFADLEIPGSLLAQNGDFVIVSIYPADGGRPKWAFSVAGSLAFSAAGAAYAALGEADPAMLKTARLKVEIASELVPCGLDARLAPGVDGLAVANKGLAFLPPDQFLDDAPTMKNYLRRLVERAGLPEGFEEKKAELMLARFTTSSVLQMAPNAEPIFLYRGNALIEPPSAEACRKSASAGIEWLARYEADGVERPYLPYSDSPGEQKLGVLAQASAAYALLVMGSSGKPAAAEPFIDAVRKNMSSDPARGTSFVVDESGMASTGASAVMLLALSERARVRGVTAADQAQLKSLAAFVLAQETAEGEFISHFDLESGKPARRLAEVHFPGQAILALVRSYELGGKKDAALLDAAKKAAGRLVANQRREISESIKKAKAAAASGGKSTISYAPDAWLMQALDALLVAGGHDESFANHLSVLAGLAMIGQLDSENTRFPDLIGGMDESDPPTVAMTASRGEGLLAALASARRQGRAEEAARILGSLELAAMYVVGNQWRPENAYALPRPERALGGFRASPLAGAMRPDTAAHAAAFLSGVAAARSPAK